MIRFKLKSLTRLMSFLLLLTFQVKANNIVEFMAGDVVITTSTNQRVQGNSSLPANIVIQTKNGKAQIQLSDGSYLSIQKNSQVKIEPGILTLVSGVVRLINVPGTSSLKLQSLKGTYKPGGDFTASNTNIFSIKSINGDGEMCSQSGCLKVSRGETVIVDNLNDEPVLSQTPLVVVPDNQVAYQNVTRSDLTPVNPIPEPGVPGETPGDRLPPGEGIPGEPALPGQPGVPTVPPIEPGVPGETPGDRLPPGEGIPGEPALPGQPGVPTVPPIEPGVPGEVPDDRVPPGEGTPGVPNIPGEPGAPTRPPVEISFSDLVMATAYIRGKNAYTYVNESMDVTINTATEIVTYAQTDTNDDIEDKKPAQSIGAIESLLGWGRFYQAQTLGIPDNNVQGNFNEVPYLIGKGTPQSYFASQTPGVILQYSTTGNTAPVFHQASGNTTVSSLESPYSNVNFSIDLTNPVDPKANTSFIVSYDQNISASVSGANMSISNGAFQTNSASCSTCDSNKGRISGLVSGPAAGQAGIVFGLPLNTGNEGLTGSIHFSRN
jgi:hypothetical protein